MGRPRAGQGVDRVAAFVRDNKVSYVESHHEGSKHTTYKLANAKRHQLTPADVRALPAGYPRWKPV